MRQYKKREQYNDCRLRYKLDMDYDLFWDLNHENYEKMKDALAAVGIMLDVTEDELKLTMIPEKYFRAKNRNAGRRDKASPKPHAEDDYHYEYYRYSDIVLMMQTMKDSDIADKIGMPIATFYRHKKKLRESTYYRKLDKNRLDDAEYLKSIEYDWMF